MRPPGSFKIARTSRPPRQEARRLPQRDPSADDFLDPFPECELRSQRIIHSLLEQIQQSEGARCLRIRQIFSVPREIFRVEFELPDMNYQRTTLLDRESVEELLEADAVQDLLGHPP